MLVASMLAVATACGQAPSNGLLNVENAAPLPASVHWQTGGLLGTPLFGASGTEPAAPCSLYTRGFPPGNVTITVTTSTTSGSFVLEIPDSSSRTLILRIGPDG